MDKDWTFLAHDRRTGRQQTIDRRWQSWGPATDPIHEYDGYFAGDDERLYRTPDGDYVLVWRADQLRQYYECDYMPVAEAKAWFARQDGLSGDPFAAQEQSAPTLDNRSYRSLWEFGRKVETALERVLCAGCNLCRDEFPLEPDANAPAIGPAVAELDAVMRLISDVDDWINTPNGADELVNTLFGIQRETRSLVIKIGHSLKPLSWGADFKRLSLLEGCLKRNIADLASIPELECELHAEALPKLQAPAPATAAADGTAPQAGDFVETPGGDIGIVEWAAYPMPEPASDEVVPPTIEAPTGESTTREAVEPAPASKAADDYLEGFRHFAVKLAAIEQEIIAVRQKAPQGAVHQVGPASRRAEPPVTAVEASASEAATVQAAVEPAPASVAAVEGKPRRLWTREAAQPIVANHLNKHPHATLEQIELATGIPHGTIGNTQAWRREAARRKRRKERRQRGPSAASFAKVERMIGQTSNAEAEALIAECAVNPELLEAIESQHDDQAADKAQRRTGRRRTV